MGGKKTLNRRLARMAWGALLIWWGVVIIIEPITIGIGAVGTGLILLGVNAIRSLKGISTRHRTTQLAFIAILWGALDQARYMLALQSELSFALLLVVSGLTVLLSPLLTRPRLHNASRTSDV
jgi:hypothetical protein